MIIVIKKADFDAQPFSNLKSACKFYNLIYNTLVRKKYPIETTDYIIHEKEIIKSVRRTNNSQNLLNQKQ